jgi:hypothetical protein
MNLPSIKSSQNYKKGLITLMTSSHTFICKTRISFSNALEMLGPPKSGNNDVSMFTVSAIVVVKAFDNIQWPFDLFMTHDDTTWFKQDVIALATTHTWAFGNLCYKATTFYLP